MNYRHIRPGERDFRSPEDAEQYYLEQARIQQQLSEKNKQVVSLEKVKNEIQQSADLTNNEKAIFIPILDKIINSIGTDIMVPLSKVDRESLQDILNTPNLSEDAKLTLTKMYQEFSTKKENNRWKWLTIILLGLGALGGATYLGGKAIDAYSNNSNK